MNAESEREKKQLKSFPVENSRIIERYKSGKRKKTLKSQRCSHTHTYTTTMNRKQLFAHEDHPKFQNNNKKEGKQRKTKKKNVCESSEQQKEANRGTGMECRQQQKHTKDFSKQHFTVVRAQRSQINRRRRQTKTIRIFFRFSFSSSSSSFASFSGRR